MRSGDGAAARPDRRVVSLIAAVLAALAAMVVVAPVGERRITRLVAAEPEPVISRRITAAILRWWQHRGIGPGSRRRRTQQRARVLQAIGALGAELEAGASPGEALLRAQGSPSVWPQAAAAVRWGDGIAEGLVADARAAPVLSQVAACWRVGSRGAGLVEAIQHVAASARAAEDVRVEMEAQLAGPRSTARLLSGLPVVGLGLGLMLGADPLDWLLGTMPGRLCLTVGVTLTLVGMWWTGRIAAGVERRL